MAQKCATFLVSGVTMRFWLRYTAWPAIRRFFKWVGRGFGPEPPITYHNIEEFCEHVWSWPEEGEPIDLKRIEASVSHSIFKYTSCGAWLRPR